MRYLFSFIFSLFCLAAFVSAQENPGQKETPKAFAFAEFAKINDRDLEKQMAAFFAELSKDPSAQGYLISYGKPAEIALIKKRMLNTSPFNKHRLYDASRITLVDGGYLKKPKTIIWIIPPGAEKPAP